MNAPPNILLVVTDQQHPDLAGYTGKTAVRTPHLDRLAALLTAVGYRTGPVGKSHFKACELSQQLLRHICSVQGPWQERPVFA